MVVGGFRQTADKQKAAHKLEKVPAQNKKGR